MQTARELRDMDENVCIIFVTNLAHTCCTILPAGHAVYGER